MLITPQAMNQGDLYNLLQALANACLDNAALAMASTTTKIKTTNAVTFRIAGKLYSKAASDNITVSGLTNTPAATFRKVRVEINAAGTVSFKEGAVGAAQVLAPLPRRSASKATLGWIEIPASFTYGTTDFNAAGVAFVDGDPDLGDAVSLPPNDRGISSTILTGP